MKIAHKVVRSVRFYLRRPKGENIPIYIVIRSGTPREGTLRSIKIPSGITVSAINWDSEKQRARRNTERFAQINYALDTIAKELPELLDSIELLGKDVFSGEAKDEVRHLVKRIVNPMQASVPIQSNKDVLAWFEDFITQRRETDRNGTVQTYITTLAHLRKYCTAKRLTLRFEDFTPDFDRAYKLYLLNESNLTNNTVAKHFKILKTFTLWAKDKEVHTIKTDKIFKSDSHKAQVRIIALTETELKAIQDLDLSDNPLLNTYRDVFVLQCYTGLRYSDVMKLHKGNVIGDRLSIFTQKTSDNIIIPLLPKAKEILTKFGYNIPPLNNQQYNDYIHTIARLAGLDEPTEQIRYSGAKAIIKTVPKYELITSHTARRTFVTLCLKKGMNAEMVMRISGHKDFKSFAKYVSFSNKDVADSLKNAWTE